MNTDIEDLNLLMYYEKGATGCSSTFSDGVRQVHFVLVLASIQAYSHVEVIEDVVETLKEQGLDFEQEIGITFPVIFIKIHLSDEATLHYIKYLNIIQEFHYDYNYADPHPENWVIWKTPLSSKNVFDEVKHESMYLTKIKIIYEILRKVPYGPEADMRGIEKLYNSRIIMDYYALHDGIIQSDYWQNDDILNDRTLLAKYWASYGLFFKEQPLDLIRKYYGTEMAFYAAWADYYNKMILPIAIIGTILFIYSYISTSIKPTSQLNFVCNSDVLMCGLCMEEFGCAQNPLSTYCPEFRTITVLEHPVLRLYSIFVTAWGMLFLRMWRRREYSLRVKWNLMDEKTEEDYVRLEFKLKAKKYIINNVTVWQINKFRKYFNYIAGGLCYFSVVMFLLLIIYGKQVLSVYVSISLAQYGLQSTEMFNQIASGVQAVITMVFSIYVKKLVGKIINVIFPKHQRLYDQMELYMVFTLDLFNNQLPLMHAAFIKDLSYNVPCKHGLPILQYNSCDPLPCLYPLFIQILMLMTLKTMMEKVTIILVFGIKKIIRNWKMEKLLKDEMPQYEEEKSLMPARKNITSLYFSQRAIQYGMVISFIYSFPLAPLCALLMNILSIRMEARQMIYRTRRPHITKTVNGIGAFHKILLLVTITGAVCNTVIMSYVGIFLHMNLIPNEENSTFIFSEFKPFEVFGKNNKKPDVPDICFYRGGRYPPNHEKRYQNTKGYWTAVFSELLAIYVFEKIAFLMYIVLENAIQKVPLKVKQQVFTDRTNLDNKYNRFFNRKLEEKFTEFNKRRPEVIPINVPIEKTNN